MELLKDRCQEILNTAALARKQSINLSTIPYAVELSKQLLSFADGMEKLFKNISIALQNGATEKACEGFLKKLVEKDEFWTKAKAGFHGGILNTKHKMNYCSHPPISGILKSLKSYFNHFSTFPEPNIRFFWSFCRQLQLLS